MVKKLDENPEPDADKEGDDALLPDHIGWRLWQAAMLWRDAYLAEMQAAGHHWFGKAQSNVLAHLDPCGSRQTGLVERSGLSKQAVQQLVDDLEASGIVYRAPDPQDKRAKIVRYTDAGKAALQDGARIKRQIEARMARGLGEGDLAKLHDLLAGIVDKGFAPGGRKPD